MKKRDFEFNKNNFIFAFILLAFLFGINFYLQSNNSLFFSPDSVSSFVTRVLPTQSGEVKLNVFVSDTVENLLIAEKIPSGFVVSEISPQPDINSDNLLAWYFPSFEGEKIVKYTINGDSDEDFQGKYGFELEDLSYEYIISGNLKRPVVQTEEATSSSSGGGGGGGGGSKKILTIINNINSGSLNSSQKEVLNEQENFDMNNLLLSEGLNKSNSKIPLTLWGIILIVVVVVAVIFIWRKKHEK